MMDQFDQQYFLYQHLRDYDTIPGVELPEGPYETAAGFIAAELGRIPMVNDEVAAGNATLTVVEMDGRRVARVRVTRRDRIDE